MKSEKVRKFLIERGYKFEEPHGGDSETTIANYYRIDRTKDVPDCICNNKPPQFAVSEFYLPANKYNDNPEYRSYKVGIRNEAPQGWIDFSFYSLDEKDILKRLDEMKNALLAVWSKLFEIKS